MLALIHFLCVPVSTEVHSDIKATRLFSACIIRNSQTYTDLRYSARAINKDICHT